MITQKNGSKLHHWSLGFPVKIIRPSLLNHFNSLASLTSFFPSNWILIKATPFWFNQILSNPLEHVFEKLKKSLNVIHLYGLYICHYHNTRDAYLSLERHTFSSRMKDYVRTTYATSLKQLSCNHWERLFAINFNENCSDPVGCLSKLSDFLMSVELFFFLPFAYQIKAEGK